MKVFGQDIPQEKARKEYLLFEAERGVVQVIIKGPRGGIRQVIDVKLPHSLDHFIECLQFVSDTILLPRRETTIRLSSKDMVQVWNREVGNREEFNFRMTSSPWGPYSKEGLHALNLALFGPHGGRFNRHSQGPQQLEWRSHYPRKEEPTVCELILVAATAARDYAFPQYESQTRVLLESVK